MRTKTITFLILMLLVIPASYAFHSKSAAKAQMSLEALALTAGTDFEEELILHEEKTGSFLNRFKLKFMGIVELDGKSAVPTFKRIDEKRGGQLGMLPEERKALNDALEEVNMLVKESVYIANDMSDAVDFWQYSLEGLSKETVKGLGKVLNPGTFKKPFGY